VDDDLGWLDATAQRQLLASGEVSARELVASAITRIERLNPALNAVIHTQFEKALENPGVPLLLKDVLATEAGQPYHCGLRAAKSSGYRATADSWLVTRYKNAGFVVLGRTNTPELAGSVTTEPLAYGPTRNPWALDHSPGGSSGGSAAAVASGMVAVAHGNDMGGSIRIPASDCGLVGLKPSRARTSLGPEFGEYWGPLTHQHVLTRTVRDSAALLDMSAGPGPGDPYSAPPPNRPWASEVATDPGRLRVGWRTAVPDGSALSTDVMAAVSGTAHLLEELGHHVFDAALPALGDPVVAAAAGTVFAVAIARDVARWSAILGRDITPELEPHHAEVVWLGKEIPATRWVADIETIQSWCRVMARSWLDVDVLLLPVMPEPPRPMGEPSPGEAGRLIAFTLPFNLTGEPAISLPLHRSVDGLPVGVQLVAPTGREDVLFRVAGQLETARPWAHLRPPTTST
jgi:amidase